MANNNSSQQRLLAIAAVVVVALLAVNAFLLYNKYSQDKVIEEQKSDIEEADKLKIELEKQYHEALSELEEMRGTNEELNAIIDQQKVELRQQKERIEGLIRDGKELNRARAELKSMGTQVQQYLAEIQQLKQERESLIAEKTQLSERTAALSTDLDSARAQNTLLSGEKSSLQAERQQLTVEKTALTETVNLASVVKVQSVRVTPLKERDSGKTVKKSKAKNVDQLKICFQTTANEVTRPGVERFYVRILNPVGETMAIDELGSGKITNKKTGEEIRFTQVKEYDYNNDEAEICFNWDPNLGAFQRGKYKVEIYNKGHLAGTGEFDLK
jgi:DNA repair ATPase RecN